MDTGLSSTKRSVKSFLFKWKLYRLNARLNRFYILNYHMIADKPNGFFPETSLEVFEKAMVHIKKYYVTMPLNEIVDRIRRKKPLRGCIAVTFDDGFRDNYTIAYGILKEFNIPATIFLSPGFIDTGKIPWFIKVRYIFMRSCVKRWKGDIGGVECDWAMGTSRERLLASDKMMQRLKVWGDDERESFLDELRDQFGINDFHEINNVMLTWEQIREMSDAGISFGAHTMSHPMLASLALEKAEEEIGRSKKEIEVRIRKNVDSFAYPFGKRTDYSESLTMVLRKMNFECAVTTVPGANGGSPNLFELRRGGPWELGMFNCNGGGS